MTLCYWCEKRIAHPWHDDGSQAPKWYLWAPGFLFGTPIEIGNVNIPGGIQGEAHE